MFKPCQILTVALSLSLCACSTQKVASGSGFLGDPSVYAALKPHPSFEGVQVVRYQDPSVLKGARFIVPPVKIYLNKEGMERNIKSEELAELAVFFRNEIDEALGDAYSITNIPGPNVKILRLAISDADPNVPLLNIHPGTVVSGVGLGGATVEMAIEDSTTGELIIAATASQPGSRYKYVSGLSKWGHTKEVLSGFAGLIRQRLDEISKGEKSAS